MMERREELTKLSLMCISLSLRKKLLYDIQLILLKNLQGRRYYSYFANKKTDAQRNYQLAQVTQWQRQGTETFLSATSQSPSDLIISPSSPSGPKSLRSQSVNFVCQYHLPSIATQLSASPFPTNKCSVIQCHREC